MIRPMTTLLTLVLSTAVAHATVPERMHYQGYLTNAQGEAVHCPDALSCPDQSFDIAFRLYDEALGGDPIWVETHEGVAVVRGTFDAALGSVVPLDPAEVADPVPRGGGAGGCCPYVVCCCCCSWE